MNGGVGILNVGAGDTKLTFDKNNPQERERAARIVADMLKRGYALLIQIGTEDGEPIYRRAKGFDPQTCEYIITGGPDETVDIGASHEPGEQKAEATQPRRKAGRPKKIPADKVHAVAVGRTAGG